MAHDWFCYKEKQTQKLENIIFPWYIAFSPAVFQSSPPNCWIKSKWLQTRSRQMKIVTILNSQEWIQTQYSDPYDFQVFLVQYRNINASLEGWIYYNLIHVSVLILHSLQLLICLRPFLLAASNTLWQLLSTHNEWQAWRVFLDSCSRLLSLRREISEKGFNRNWRSHRRRVLQRYLTLCHVPCVAFTRMLRLEMHLSDLTYIFWWTLVINVLLLMPVIIWPFFVAPLLYPTISCWGPELRLWTPSSQNWWSGQVRVSNLLSMTQSSMNLILNVVSDICPNIVSNLSNYFSRSTATRSQWYLWSIWFITICMNLQYCHVMASHSRHYIPVQYLYI